MTRHSRREEYWQFYGHVVAETAHLMRMLIRVRPCPRPEGGNRGWPLVHFEERLDFACLWSMAVMTACNRTYRMT